MGKKTRFKDKNVGGSYAYDGKIEERNGRIYVVYYDIGDEEALPLFMFPKCGREIILKHME